MPLFYRWRQGGLRREVACPGPHGRKATEVGPELNIHKSNDMLPY